MSTDKFHVHGSSGRIVTSFEFIYLFIYLFVCLFGDGAITRKKEKKTGNCIIAL
jgi:hypothetical protein